jgi:hypothetical protein
MSEPFNPAQPSDGSIPKDVLMPKPLGSDRVETIRSLMERGTIHVPTRYGNCRCLCHVTPGMSHIAACCSPWESDSLEGIIVRD